MEQREIKEGIDKLVESGKGRRRGQQLVGDLEVELFTRNLRKEDLDSISKYAGKRWSIQFLKTFANIALGSVAGILVDGALDVPYVFSVAGSIGGMLFSTPLICEGLEYRQVARKIIDLWEDGFYDGEDFDGDKPSPYFPQDRFKDIEWPYLGRRFRNQMDFFGRVIADDEGKGTFN